MQCLALWPAQHLAEHWCLVVFVLVFWETVVAMSSTMARPTSCRTLVSSGVWTRVLVAGVGLGFMVEWFGGWKLDMES